MAGSEGPRTEPFRIDMPMMESPGFYNLDILDGLDYCLEELRKRDMTATMVLTNYWQWVFLIQLLIDYFLCVEWWICSIRLLGNKDSHSLSRVRSLFIFLFIS